jgi:hypothetical protein
MLMKLTVGDGSCAVIYQDSLIIFGGSHAGTIVQQFNFTSGLWKNLAPMPVPHFYFGCVILPQSMNQVF